MAKLTILYHSESLYAYTYDILERAIIRRVHRKLSVKLQIKRMHLLGSTHNKNPR